jgi:microcystin-dependent protein
MFGGNFAPVGWLFCDGSVLPISQYETLFVLIGTTYGGDGQNTFALPDLRGRIPVHQRVVTGQPSYVIGQQGGQESRTLTSANLPQHTHVMQVSGAAATVAQPEAGLMVAATSTVALYNTEGINPVGMNPSTLSPTGNSAPIDLMMPFQVISFIIATEGIFPNFN